LTVELTARLYFSISYLIPQNVSLWNYLEFVYAGKRRSPTHLIIGSIAEKKIRQKINGFKKLFGGPLTIHDLLRWKV